MNFEWFEKDGHIMSSELVTTSNPDYRPGTEYGYHPTIAFNVGAGLASYIVQLHNSKLSADANAAIEIERIIAHTKQIDEFYKYSNQQISSWNTAIRTITANQRSPNMSDTEYQQYLVTRNNFG